MTTLRDISDTYDCDELHSNIAMWMKNNTPTVDDVEMYLIRLRTLNFLVNYSESPLVIQTFEALASQLNEEHRCALIEKMLKRPNQADNLRFLSAISNASPAAEQVLLAAWVPSAISYKTAHTIINLLSNDHEYNGVLLNKGFLNNSNYLTFLRTDSKSLIDLLINKEWSKEIIQRVADNNLLHEKLLFPLLAQFQKSNRYPETLVQAWNGMFPSYVAQEAARIATYMTSQYQFENFVSCVPMNSEQKFSFLLEWVSRMETNPSNTRMVDVLNSIDWDETKFSALKNAYMIGNGFHPQNLENFSVMWANAVPENLHDHLYTHVANAHEFSTENNWVRQRLLLKRETQKTLTTSPTLQRKI